MKKILSIMLALAMMLSMVSATFAASDYTITINNDSSTTNVSIVDKEFYAFQVYEMTYSDTNFDENTTYGYAITDVFQNFVYNDKSGRELIEYLEGIKDNSDELNEFAKAAYQHLINEDKWMSPDATAVGATVSGTKEAAVFENLEDGYYLIYGAGDPVQNDEDTSEVVSAIILTPSAPSAVINFKGSVPPIDKNIIKVDRNSSHPERTEETKGTDAQIGDKITFEITSEVPDMTAFDSYVFRIKDKMTSGLTFQETSLKVTIGGTAISADKYNFVFDEADNSFVIDFIDFIQYKELVGSEILVTYKAELNENAETTYEETNTAKIEYSNDSTTDSYGETIEIVNYVYDFEIEINKVDEEGKPLEGVEFVLFRAYDHEDAYYDDGRLLLYNYDGEDVTWWTSANLAEWNIKTIDQTFNTDSFRKTFLWDTAGTIRGMAGVDVIKKTDANGKIDFTGLDEGKYVLVEITTLDGYNMLEAPIFIDLNAMYKEDGKLIRAWAEYSYNGTTKEMNITMSDQDEDPTVTQLGIDVEVENTSGAQLPSTGGIGTTIFYVIGSILVLGSVVVFVTKRRMGATEE